VPAASEPPGSGALAALPVVGAVLGAAAGAAGWAAARTLPEPCGAAVSLAALAILSGAIHDDGFLDGCDAFFASTSPERRLEILKDPRHGTFAVVGFTSIASLTLAALAAIPPARYPAVLAFAAATARAAAVTGAFVFPGARGARERPHFARDAGSLTALGASLGVLAACSIGFGRRGIAFVPGAVVLALGTERWICGRIGGLVGDAYGFAITIVSSMTIVAVSSAVARE
jgi:adenosylcobinamide-GDP ribazoletransferase